MRVFSENGEVKLLLENILRSEAALAIGNSFYLSFVPTNALALPYSSSSELLTLTALH
jgi:hypothetical protein